MRVYYLSSVWEMDDGWWIVMAWLGLAPRVRGVYRGFVLPVYVVASNASIHINALSVPMARTSLFYLRSSLPMYARLQPTRS